MSIIYYYLVDSNSSVKNRKIRRLFSLLILLFVLYCVLIFIFISCTYDFTKFHKNQVEKTKHSNCSRKIRKILKMRDGMFFLYCGVEQKCVNIVDLEINCCKWFNEYFLANSVSIQPRTDRSKFEIEKRVSRWRIQFVGWWEEFVAA